MIASIDNFDVKSTILVPILTVSKSGPYNKSKWLKMSLPSKIQI